MKKNVIGLVAMALALTGCNNNPVLNVSYLGQSYPPTDHVDVYFSPKSVKVPYNVMGRMELQATDFANGTELQNAVQRQAAMRGADGVIITAFKRQPDGSTVMFDYDGFDDFYPWGFGPAEGMAVSTPIEDKVIDAKLIKYQSSAATTQPMQMVVGTQDTESPIPD